MFNLPNHIKILDYDLMVDKKISNEYIIFKRFVYIGRIQVHIMINIQNKYHILVI